MIHLPIKDFSKRTLKIVKTIHIITAALWLGGIVNAFLIFMSGLPEDIMFSLLERIGISSIVPAALTSLFTGLYYGLFTRWGFFKYPWLTLKWILMIVMMVCGIVGHPAVPLYISQLSIMLLIIIISVYKPGGCRKPKVSTQ